MKRPRTFLQTLPAFLGGIAVGLTALLWLRVQYYDLMGYRPEMHPGVAYGFAPIIAVALLAVVIPLELAFHRWWFRPASNVQSFVIGACHVTLLVWWAFPGHALIGLLVNPVLLRWGVGKCQKPNPQMEPDAASDPEGREE